MLTILIKAYCVSIVGDIKPIYLKKRYLFQNDIYYLDKIYLCFAKIKLIKHWLGRNEKNKRKISFELVFLCIATCFLRVFQQTKRLENLQIFLFQFKNIIVEKNIFSLIFLFHHQFFVSYKTFDLNT